jgi:hypothetical protein
MCVGPQQRRDKACPTCLFGAVGPPPNISGQSLTCAAVFLLAFLMALPAAFVRQAADVNGSARECPAWREVQWPAAHVGCATEPSPNGVSACVSITTIDFGGLEIGASVRRKTGPPSIRPPPPPIPRTQLLPEHTCVAVVARGSPGISLSAWIAPVGGAPQIQGAVVDADGVRRDHPARDRKVVRRLGHGQELASAAKTER